MISKSFNIFVQNYRISIERNHQKNETLTKNEINELLIHPENKIIYHSLPEKCLSDLCLQNNLVEAAGGIIVNRKNNHWLMIFRRGYWDLPKGKIDKGEHPFFTATREIAEETGVNVEQTASTFIDVSYHFYKQNNQVILKRTYWYMFFVDDTPALKLQYEEDIEKAEWVGQHNWLKIRQNTYASIIHILEQTNLL